MSLSLAMSVVRLGLSSSFSLPAGSLSFLRESKRAEPAPTPLNTLHMHTERHPMHAKQEVLRGDQHPGQEQDEQDRLGPDLEGNGIAAFDFV